MDSDRANSYSDFEEREKKILEFEQNLIENEEKLKTLTKECEDLNQKLKLVEESQDEMIATQLKELRAKLEESDQMTTNLRSALQNLQEDNIKLEDELNAFKSEHGDINEVKEKLQVLEETVITQQKEIVEKDKILKGRQEEGEVLESALQKFIVGKVETVKEFNHLLENAKFRLFLIVPTIEDLKQLNLPDDSNIDMRVATAFDLENKFHREYLESYSNVDFRVYSKRDRWGIERDAEEICLVAESENKDYIGISSSDSKICELFLKLLTEAWLTADKVSL